MNTQAQSSGQNLSGPWLTTTIPILVTIIPQRTTTLSTIIHGSPISLRRVTIFTAGQDSNHPFKDNMVFQKQFVNPRHYTTTKLTNYTNFPKMGNFEGRATHKFFNFFHKEHFS